MKVYSFAAILLVALLGTGCCGLAGGGTDKYMCKSKQAEGQAKLSALLLAANTAKAETGQYPKTVAEAKLDVSDLKFYDLNIVTASGTSFIAEAKGKGDMAGDEWRIDESGKLSNPADKCSK